MGPGVQLARIQVRVRRWTPVGTPVPFPSGTEGLVLDCLERVP